jgi:hypothetical protein
MSFFSLSFLASQTSDFFNSTNVAPMLSQIKPQANTTGKTGSERSRRKKPASP